MWKWKNCTILESFCEIPKFLTHHIRNYHWISWIKREFYIGSISICSNNISIICYQVTIQSTLYQIGTARKRTVLFSVHAWTGPGKIGFLACYTKSHINWLEKYNIAPKYWKREEPSNKWGTFSQKIKDRCGLFCQNLNSKIQRRVLEKPVCN